MSVDGQFHSLGADDWIEQFREANRQCPPPLSEAVLDAAYEAGEIDTPTMFAYFEGRLTEEERQEVEAEAALSHHAMKKMARIGAIVAQSLAQSPAKVASLTADGPQRSAAERTIHRVQLDPPRPSIGSHLLPRSEDCIRSTPDSPCEFYRSLEKDRDQVRNLHNSAPVGTLVGLCIKRPGEAGGTSDNRPDQFAVLRMSSESTTTTTLTIPESFGRREVVLEVVEIPPGELSGEEARSVLNSYERAAIEDPVAVTPLHEPRSAWQLWADGVLQTPRDQIDHSLREIAELIASS